jgi:uncharacterized membrane protein
MNDERDETYIEVLFGIGMALGITALLAFDDGEHSLGLVFLGLALVGFVVIFTHALRRYFRRRKARNSSIWRR